MNLNLQDNEDKSYGILKIGEKQWIEKLYNGELSFSCAQAFIEQGRFTTNREQGDPHDAIFGQLLPDNPLIKEMQQKLGDDLELLEYDPFILLRRRSACYKPIICFYTIKQSDFVFRNPHMGLNKVTIPIDPKIQNGFLDELPYSAMTKESYNKRMPMVAFFLSKSFFDTIGLFFKIKNEKIISRAIKYEIYENREFFIEPTDSYDELFYKRTRYSYQHEVRMMLPNRACITAKSRLNYNVGVFPEKFMHEGLTHIETHISILSKRDYPQQN